MLNLEVKRQQSNPSRRAAFLFLQHSVFRVQYSTCAPQKNRFYRQLGEMCVDGRASRIVHVAIVPIVFVTHAPEDAAVDRVIDLLNRAICKNDVDDARVGRPKPFVTILATALCKIRLGRSGCAPNRVFIPAGGIAFVVVVLRFAQATDVHAFVASQ